MISACLIVLNEEYFIRQCLEALLTCPVDEIIIVDGGSIDNTLGIINEFAVLNHKIKLFMNKMPYSFAEQRNFAKSCAKGDWILSVDADETLEGAELLEELVKSEQLIGYSFPTRHLERELIDRDPHIRLFKNIPEIQWERPIHEYLTYKDEFLISHPANMGEQREMLLQWILEVTIVHWAFTAPEEILRDKAKNYMKYNKEGAGIQINSEEDLLSKWKGLRAGNDQLQYLIANTGKKWKK